jgi:hypothetical protein
VSGFAHAGALRITRELEQSAVFFPGSGIITCLHGRKRSSQQRVVAARPDLVGGLLTNTSI